MRTMDAIANLRKINETHGDDPDQDQGWEPIISLEAVDLPKFPVEALPDWMRDYALALSEFTETPIEMSAMFTIGAVNAAIIGRFKIEVKRGYTESNALWIMVILATGNRKSPCLSAAFKPLRQMQDLLMENFREQKKRADIVNDLIFSEIKKVKKNLKKESLDKIHAQIAELKSKLIEITPPQIIIDDITSEALAEGRSPEPR